MVEVLGWASSVVLVVTIGSQIRRQQQQASSKGVSPWLYVGQFVASVGLLIYSALSQQWVFVVLNSVMAGAAIVGGAIWHKYRSR